MAAATDAHGKDGSTMRGDIPDVLSPSDLALFRNPEWAKESATAFPAMFAHGLEGYTDDRLADGAGWVTFDVNSIRCPVSAFAEQFTHDHDPDFAGCDSEGEPVSLRELLVHMIEEYARHNGHADLLRERIDGRVGQ